MYSLGNIKRNEAYQIICGELSRAYLIEKEKSKNSISKNIKIMLYTGTISQKIKAYELKKKRKKIKEIAFQNPLWKEPLKFICNEKIVIYTVIFGSYDKIQEPSFIPDNCDFYIITDQEVRTDSAWVKLDISKWNHIIKDFSNIQKNRFFKMKAHEIFPNYRYSIYIDGNIKPKLDFSAMIYRISDYGIALHRHSSRVCAYDEAEYIKIVRKDSAENVNKYIQHLKREGLPLDYGLLQCSVIVRDHHNVCCQNIMNQWWNEYVKGCNRDQLSLPLVLYKLGINTFSVDGLGDDVLKNPLFDVIDHKKL